LTGTIFVEYRDHDNVTIIFGVSTASPVYFIVTRTKKEQLLNA